MSLKQFQKDGLLVLRTLLNPGDPQNNMSDEYKAHLRALSPLLTGVVENAIDTIDSPKDYEHRWLRKSISERARRIRMEQGRGAHAPDPWPTAAGGKKR